MPHELVGDQDQGEGREHLRQVIALVEAPQQRDLEQHADQRRAADRQREPARRTSRSPPTAAAIR